MVTRATTAAELAELAKSAGWRVTQPKSLTGAFKVWMDKGACQNAQCNHIAQIHLTPSDPNFHRVVRREMEAHGLDAAKERTEKKRETVRQAKIIADRAANATALARAEALAKQRTAVNKAAGPYSGAEAVPLAWFVDDHPSKWTRSVIMTPELASGIIELCKHENRPVRAMTVNKYASIMTAGDWKHTHQGISIDVGRRLQDGRHRLLACIKSGVTIVIDVTVGAPEENFGVVDDGLGRTAAQLLGKMGETQARTMSGMVKLIMAFDTGDRSQAKASVTMQQTLRYVGEHSEEMRPAAVWATRNSKALKITPSAAGAACYLLQRENGIDNPFVVAFLRGLVTTRKLDTRLALDEEDPRLKLRAYITNARDRKKTITAFDQVCLFVMTWNYSLINRGRQYLRWGDNQGVPTVHHISPDAPIPYLLTGEVDRDDVFAASA